jgi:hypothetical protein
MLANGSCASDAYSSGSQLVADYTVHSLFFQAMAVRCTTLASQSI